MYEIVTNTASTMKKLPLIIRAEILREKLLIVENWKFHKVIFKSLIMNFNTFPIMVPIGSQVREIKFVDCSQIRLEVLQYILWNFPEVEKISFYDRCMENRIHESNKNMFQLENLKELVLKQNCLKVNYDQI